ncbi:trypsin-like peptidase domain-containing protein [Paenibacillus frigoriresistens]|uniref:S1C family serine protease n=1 Tax=Paenibacillus alginolyticus TaxID=59839 RepID=UPI001563B16F|nr:trypsin-like peptidase domain-containing protein [Paenibacillus frigoriresistens]NRF94784.1 trypsin-like peptidase domain-containing protein [Paenibacillus frigoriresistens]
MNEDMKNMINLNNIKVENKTRNTKWRPMFAAFMAGAVVVGGLMFTSDKLNLFGYAAGPVQSGVTAAATNSTASGVQTASLTPSGTNSISSIAKAASPAIVKIETKVKQTNIGQNRRNLLGQGTESGDTIENGIGSGFVFDSSGYILTNEHVINGADEIDVYVQGYDTPFTAKLLGSSYDLDLAVLKIEGDKAFPALNIGNSDNTQVGDWLVAIGNPYDFDYSVTTGVLSAKERTISIDDEQGTRNYKHLLQTDTAINPGNSGGPLLNMNGEVIGINTAVNAEAQGMGFAIPASTISSVVDKLKNNETIPKEPAPYIGVALQNISDNMLDDLKINSTKGAVVTQVQQGTPAFQAGIRQYDVILNVNGTAISSTDDITKAVQAAAVGDELKITISRDGQTKDVIVKVGNRNAETGYQS